MAEFKLITDYQDNERYRLSFNRLTNTVFGFDLEEWYRKGFWNERYLPYSFVDGDEVIANVSVNKMDLILLGEKKRAIQIGTVMTHPDYRGRGLSGRLMNLVLNEYENEADFIYLFANKNVLNFYPKFGFEPRPESRFTVTIAATGRKRFGRARKLNPFDPETLRRLYEMASSRKPVSRVLGVENAHNLVMFYCLKVFSDCLYYIEAEAVLAICQIKDRVLHVYDLISSEEFDIHGVIATIADAEVERMVFHFTPDLLGLKTEDSPLLAANDTFFVRGDSFDIDRSFKYPVIAQA
jgi:GNAT superfamily N-acetyltransferase